MKGFIFYRIGTYLLLLSIGFSAILLMSFLSIALAHPQLLFECFLLASYILYSYTSYRFMSRGMINQLSFKKSFKGFLRVNCFGTLVMALIIFINLGYLLMKPDALDKTVEDFISNNNIDMSHEALTELLRKTSIGIGIFFSLVTVHVFVTLKLIKKYAYLFDDQA
ncbi:hypothetical protein [Gynurincola endophyticus]|jgi:hypothetical protein|uniref:hypothetical protein n=1 Tax=Gynurincola endophyticus TaxID=2479004 RepID=UPI000F8D2062|nr:hypothetical protein [Gynurincola endophyticus]